MGMSEMKQLIMQKIDVNNNIEQLGGFSQLDQVLFLIENGFVTPKQLIEKIGVQKTNLSLLCKKLLEKKLISKTRAEEDKKQILYSLTVKGKTKLQTKLKDMQIMSEKRKETK